MSAWVERHTQHRGMLVKTFGVFHVALGAPIPRCLLLNISMEQLYHKICCWAVCYSHVRLGLEQQLPRLQLESGAGFLSHFSGQQKRAGRGGAQCRSGAQQWLSVELPALQLTLRSGTPGPVACYCNWILLLWIWEWIGPERAAPRTSDLLRLLAF